MREYKIKVSIADYLSKNQILFLEVKERKEALIALVDLLDRAGKLREKEQFFSSILQREKIVSTGIGLGVAIPHAKLEGYEDFFIAIGIQKEGMGLEWNALDGVPVRLIFMIGGPDNRQTDYLQILSSLTTAIKDGVRRKNLLASKTPDQVLDWFQKPGM
ncbi:MAG: PTS sugar transporter subunit IIA [Chlamydiae bacterium GWC2_50_10]|nr:MAG: PTS sugar transporter subunit IIA [Chlamydiae bacterium GWC2_50_10]OGN57988.1 MAG: PTS sugar transporter subunit IIA [Chlamydiae bacterium RIFCSPHIGHO2_02_FULL_49_29]OGN63184.1 MAG: PTS sugar transporter subunit IIA [Chlamydiae bacterium RIFCSPHIGHO2_12_FULL_49_32]OGN67624.1 MAG: PTS sugar transporter subunit IIA [Chlamydiae bacterium RIFCSPLOWO2_02_FULL_49_12]OGN70925.1 MAG: PTS sugar transporter subunit IIA [Chlamydiae bacterium RIFCSPLOWO2_12_FULL_49_12]HCJ82897.1 PTS sugar transpor